MQDQQNKLSQMEATKPQNLGPNGKTSKLSSWHGKLVGYDRIGLKKDTY